MFSLFKNSDLRQLSYYALLTDTSDTIIHNQMPHINFTALFCPVN
jgi:hypothetical protein